MSNDNGSQITSEKDYLDDGPYGMNENILFNRLDNPNKGTFCPQFLLTVAISIASVSNGMTMAWSNAILGNYSHHTDVKVNDERYSWMCSLAPLGCLIGVIPCFYLSYRFGPRKCILYCFSIISLITWLLLALNKKREYGRFVIVCRLFGGFAICGITICCNQWLVHSVHMEYLKTFRLMEKCAELFGFLVSGILDMFISIDILCFINAGIVVVYFVIMVFLPESPVHLCETSESKAVNALRWYLGEQEASDTIRYIRKHAYSRKQLVEFDQFMLTKKTVYKPLLIVLVLVFFQVMSGYYAILFYHTYIWSNHKVMSNKDYDILAFLVFMIVDRLLAVYIHYNIPIGTRLPILLSFATLVISYAFLAAFNYVQKLNSFFSMMNWISMPLWNLVVIAYEIGLSLYPDIILQHYLPIQINAQATCYAYAIHWGFKFVLVKMFITVLKLGDHYLYMGLMFIMMAGFLFAYFMIIDTKDLSLVQIQIAFGGNPAGNRGAIRQRKLFRSMD